MKSKTEIFDALDILNSINMEYDKYQTKCSHCKVLGTGNVQFDCNQKGYCPSYLSDSAKQTLSTILTGQ